MTMSRTFSALLPIFSHLPPLEGEGYGGGAKGTGGEVQGTSQRSVFPLCLLGPSNISGSFYEPVE
jgi:hypothetical protein